VAETIFLRPLTAEDIDETYVSWFRDEQVTAFLEARNISREDAIAHLEAGRIDNSYVVYAIIHAQSGIHVGNIKLGPVNWKHRFADCVTVIGRRDFWGRGIATTAIREAIRIAFDDLDLRRLTASIADGNDGSVRAYTRAGFQIEGRLAGQWLIDGQARDSILIGCLNPRYFPEAES